MSQACIFFINTQESDCGVFIWVHREVASNVWRQSRGVSCPYINRSEFIKSCGGLPRNDISSEAIIAIISC